MPKCLITGCALFVNDEQKWAYGDLHQLSQDGAHIFYACLTENEGDTLWYYNSLPPPSSRVVIVIGDYFDRRGVIVFRHAVLNEIAECYLKG